MTAQSVQLEQGHLTPFQISLKRISIMGTLQTKFPLCLNLDSSFKFGRYYFESNNYIIERAIKHRREKKSFGLAKFNSEKMAS